MNQNSFDQVKFKKYYQQSVADVFCYWTPAMQAEIAKHCYGWREGATDFKEYLIASEIRYEIAYSTLCASGKFSSLCDIGGFYGVFPLTMARLGYSVTMTETLQYYSDSFKPLFTFLRDNNVRIIDYDPFAEIAGKQHEFDVVTALAVLEHYPHSPKHFMRNMLQMLNTTGRIYIETPNIAYWHKRICLMRGETPLVHISDIYHSAIPFIGHTHEYTLGELHALATLADLEVLRINTFNYSFRGAFIKKLISHPLLLLMTLLPTMRECIAILARRTSIPTEHIKTSPDA